MLLHLHMYVHMHMYIIYDSNNTRNENGTIKETCFCISMQLIYYLSEVDCDKSECIL